jgi:hypothetical protein
VVLNGERCTATLTKKKLNYKQINGEMSADIVCAILLTLTIKMLLHNGICFKLVALGCKMLLNLPHNS